MTNPAVTAARAMVPEIRAAREETEARRCIAPSVAEGLKASGLARMAVVEDLGGLETPTVEALTVYEILAGAEASASWVAWNNALPGLFSRFLSPDARAEIFSDPAWLYANSTRPSGRAVAEGDAYRVEGHWSLVSGCQVADWLALMCLVEEDGEPRMLLPGMPELRVVFLRKDACEILDTWHSGGLRGSGSHDVRVRDQRAPRHHTLSPLDPPTLERPIGRVPISCTMGAGFAAQALGIAFAALETVLGLARTKVSPDPHPDLRDRPDHQASAATHATALEAARSHLHACVGRIWDEAVREDPIGREDLAAAWGAAHHANAASLGAMRAMYAIGGTSSLYTDCPLERSHRDLHAMMRHTIAQRLWMENAGRVLFGLDPTEPLYAL